MVNNLIGMGVDPLDIDLGDMTNYSDYTTIHKDDLQLMQNTLGFAKEVIMRQDDFITMLMNMISKMQVEEKGAGAWNSILDMIKQQYTQLQAFGLQGAIEIQQKAGRSLDAIRDAGKNSNTIITP